jgi:hypothetical protein
VHTEHGDGWVWGSGLGRVTVRFETAETPPGPVRTFAVDDPALVTLASLHEAEELAEAEELREADELPAGAPEADEAALIQVTGSAAGRIGR